MAADIPPWHWQDRRSLDVIRRGSEAPLIDEIGILEDRRSVCRAGTHRQAGTGDTVRSLRFGAAEDGSHDLVQRWSRVQELDSCNAIALQHLHKTLARMVTRG